MDKKLILSCMQPTSHLHLGNYLGALKNWVKLARNNDFTEKEIRQAFIDEGWDEEIIDIFLSQL